MTSLGKIGARSLARRLPYDAEVEYLESDGNAYIDCGFKPTDAIAFQMKFYRPNNSVRWDCGAEDGWGVNIARFIAIDGSSGNMSWRFGKNIATSGAGFVVTSSSNAVGLCSVSIAQNSCEVQNLTTGMSYTKTVSSTTAFISGNNFILFGVGYQGGSGDVSIRGARLMYAKITDLNINQDLIPVRFTNELGQSEGAMYDRANPTVGMNRDGSARTDGLYLNRGTGAFLFGPDK